MDMVDEAARFHDLAYFKAKASGVKGALLDLKVARADAELSIAALVVIVKYKRGGD